MGHVGVGITLAGDVTIRAAAVDGTRVRAPRRLRGSQTAAVFAALTLERHEGIVRDALADIVWPDGLPTTWSSALRSLVSRIRDVIAPVVPGGRAALRVEAGHHRLFLPLDTLIDVEAAERGIAAARQRLAAGDHARAWQRATAAVACLRAPFLPGHHGPWVNGRREKLAELLVAGLEVSSRAATGRGDDDAALVAAADAVGRAPLRESAHRCLMLAHAAAGNRGEALRAYQRLRRTLAEQLGVDPAPATEDVYLDLLGHPPTRPPAGDPERHTWHTRRTPGDRPGAHTDADRRRPRRPDADGPGPAEGVDAHQVELAVLTDAWRRALNRTPTVVLVTGPAGAGKSRLVAEAARRATADGGLVLFGGCDPARPLAYGPFLEAFDGLLAAAPDDELSMAPGIRAELVRLLRSSGRSSAADQVALADALTELLAGLTTARPAMLVLDDLQWAGADTFPLLQLLVHQAGAQGILFVALARDGLPPDQPLHATATAMHQRGWLRRLPLRGTDVAAPAGVGALGVVGRLPNHGGSFVGRKAECDRTLAALRAGRLVTIAGTGGVGKTRLAVEVVRRSRLADHPDGVRYCDVAPRRDADDLVHHVATALGLAAADPDQLRHELAAALRTSELLLVLDGCEHLRSAVAELVAELLDTGTASRVLVTSRAPLRARDERVITVAPLPVPAGRTGRTGRTGDARTTDAVRLLVDRARDAGAAIADDDPALAEIAGRLDGLPLALELAAPRLATLAPADLAADLGRTFDLLGRSTTGPARQRTLQATVEWSWALLGRPAGRLLAALSVFRTGWTLDGARAVARGVGVDPAAVPALLAELAEHSMIHPDNDDATSRYRMLGAVAAYATARLAVSGDQAAVQERHALHFAELAEEALPHRRGPAEPIWARRLELDHDDLRSACRWSIDAGQPVVGLRLVAALAEDVMLRDRLEVGRWAEELAALPEVRDEPLRAAALGVAATTALAEDRLDDALRLAVGALAAERGSGASPCWISRNVLALLAAVDMTSDAIDEDLRDLLIALDRIAHTGADPLVGATLLHQYVLAYAFAGQAHKGLDAANELLALGAEHPSPTIRAMGLLAHGMAIADRQPHLAAREYRSALDLATTAHSTTLVQRAERALQELHARSSDRRTTLGALRALVRQREPSDGLSEQIQTMVAMLDALVALGDLRSAATICGGLADTPWRQGTTYRRADDAAATGLPPDDYCAAHSAGTAMSTPELVAFTHGRAHDLVQPATRHTAASPVCL